jgi:MFS family permease
MTLHRSDPEPTDAAPRSDRSFDGDVLESLVMGDEEPSPRPGTARAAFAHRDFRRMWIGSFGSNIGSWMQQVVLASYAFRLTGSAAFVGLLGFAQLGPLMLLSIPGGVVADMVDRRRWLVGLQTAMALLSLGLAALVAGAGDPPLAALFALVLGIGIANALNAPAWSAVVPKLVPARDLPGAISLNSTMINGTRVIGPAIGGLLYPLLGPAWIFVINAATFAFIIGALLTIRFPVIPRATETGWRRVSAGFRAAREDRVVGRLLLVLPVFSFFCLPFVSLFAALAEIDLGMNSKSLAYGLLYAAFGLGAAAGSLAVGTILARVDKRLLVRFGFLGFAATLLAFGLLRAPAPAYPVVFALGACYFGTTTSMLTIVQMRVDDAVRARVMALWFMGFGGTVPIGGLVFGPLLDATDGTVVLAVGAAVAVGLSFAADLRRLEPGRVAVVG